MTSKEKVGIGPGLRLRGVVHYRAPPNAGVWPLAGLAFIHQKTGDKRHGRISSPRRLSLVADVRYASLTRVGVERRLRYIPDALQVGLSGRRCCTDRMPSGAENPPEVQASSSRKSGNPILLCITAPVSTVVPHYHGRLRAGPVDMVSQ